MPDIRVATRSSALARSQTLWVREKIQQASGAATSEVLVTTQGDTSQAALTSFGGQGVFVSAVREALLDGRADVAVHSMKDLPTADEPGTAIAAVPQREDVRDFVVARVDALEDLPEGATVATGSPRRTAFLLRLRPDLQVVGIRGNVDTRVGKVGSGEVDAVVVAAAGLRRLGLTPPGFPLTADQMLPAVGQGALAVEMRRDDPLSEAVRSVDDAIARAETTAERALLAGLRAGCSAPVAALARVRGEHLELQAIVLSHDGAQMYECTITGPVAEASSLGARAAENLIGQGAGQLLGVN